MTDSNEITEERERAAKRQHNVVVLTTLYLPFMLGLTIIIWAAIAYGVIR